MNQVEFAELDLWWRAANYLSVGQIYLLANPLLREPLKIEHVKPRLLGHWGTTPGLNFIYAHPNRIINARDQDMIYVCGPGHGGPGMVANTWLEGSYTELVPAIGRDEAGMQRLFKQFSFPGGIPSHDAPNVPGSINEGGELGYSLLHAAGAVFDNKDLVAACVVGDGEAETGAAAASWHLTKFLNPARDGFVLPILHLNGYKIAGPIVLARISEAELISLFRGYGWEPTIVSGHDPALMHPAMADALDSAMDRIADIKAAAATAGSVRQAWPMIIDTAFHQTLPPLARQLALPNRLGLRRYGFHGLSYEWIAGQLPPNLAAGRVVVAHLGSGASLCALEAGRSVETTMSTTPLDGLVMSTRCGSLDPGVVLHLVRELGIDAVEHLLYHEAGLLGVSGKSGDMRELRDAGPAFDLFAYRTAMEIARMAAALGGLEGLVFTGGIGEHDGAVRAAVCAKLGWLGAELDPISSAPGLISTPDSRVKIWVIPTDEEAVIARQTSALAVAQP